MNSCIWQLDYKNEDLLLVCNGEEVTRIEGGFDLIHSDPEKLEEMKRELEKEFC